MLIAVLIWQQQYFVSRKTSCGLCIKRDGGLSFMEAEVHECIAFRRYVTCHLFPFCSLACRYCLSEARLRRCKECSTLAAMVFAPTVSRNQPHQPGGKIKSQPYWT